MQTPKIDKGHAAGGAVGLGTALQAEDHGFDSSGVTWILHWHNSSSCTVALGTTQPLQPVTTAGNLIYHIQVPTAVKPDNPNLLEPPGPVQGLISKFDT